MAADDSSSRIRCHATCVAFGGRGLLLTGRSGAGKSALALAFLARGGWLVADDLVVLERRADHLYATGEPSPLGRGLLEARGLGIFRLPGPRTVPVAACFDLQGSRGGPRLPQPSSDGLLGVEIPVIPLDSSGPDAEAKLRLAVLTVREH